MLLVIFITLLEGPKSPYNIYTYREIIISDSKNNDPQTYIDKIAI